MDNVIQFPNSYQDIELKKLDTKSKETDVYMAELEEDVWLMLVKSKNVEIEFIEFQDGSNELVFFKTKDFSYGQSRIVENS